MCDLFIKTIKQIWCTKQLVSKVGKQNKTPKTFTITVYPKPIDSY